jgi:hypothetical protein
MHRGRVLVVGKSSGRAVGSVTTPDEISAREKAIDFYEIEPALLRVRAVELDSAKVKPRDHLVSLWHRDRRVSSSR